MTSCPALCNHHRSKGQGVFHFYFFISTFIVIPDDTGFSLVNQKFCIVIIHCG